jgi:hypothetical protein
LTLSFADAAVLSSPNIPGSPQSVVVADFDQDTNLDIAVINNDGATPGINLFLGAGDGTFSLAGESPFGSGNTNNALAAGELSGDANPELAVAKQNDEVSVLQGPDFSTQQNESVAAGPAAIVVADLDGAGGLDVATVSGIARRLTLLINQGGLTFDVVEIPAAGDSAHITSPKSLVAADFDDDGRIDLAVGNLNENKVGVFTNTGDANPANLFSDASAQSVDVAPGGIQGVASGDFNDDGHGDLAVPNVDNRTTSVLLHDGDASFLSPITLPAGQDAFSAAVGDFDLDGHLDLVVVHSFGHEGTNGDLSVHLGKGDGTFQNEQIFGVGMDGVDTVHPRSVAVGDFNDDGKPDLVTANDLINGTISVLINTSS